MEKRGGGWAWGIAVLAVVGMMASAVWGFLEHERALALEVRVQHAETVTQQVQMQAQEQQQSVQTLEVKIAELEGSLHEAAAAVEQPGAEGATAPADLSDAAGSAGAEGAPAGEKPAEGEGAPNFAKMFEGEQGEKMVRMSADAAVTMYYDDLLTSLNLPAEEADKVRQILGDHLARQITQGMKSTGGSSSPAERTQAKQDAEGAMRSDLAQVLNDQELTKFDEYQEGIEERAMRKAFEMQMGVFTTGMSEENRQMAVDVMVEEFLALDDPKNPAAAEYPDKIAAQGAALDRTRERMSTVLDDAQMRQLDSFLQQQRAGLAMAQQMMGGGEKKPEQK